MEWNAKRREEGKKESDEDKREREEEKKRKKERTKESKGHTRPQSRADRQAGHAGLFASCVQPEPLHLPCLPATPFCLRVVAQRVLSLLLSPLPPSLRL